MPAPFPMLIKLNNFASQSFVQFVTNLNLPKLIFVCFQPQDWCVISTKSPNNDACTFLLLNKNQYNRINQNQKLSLNNCFILKNNNITHL